MTDHEPTNGPGEPSDDAVRALLRDAVGDRRGPADARDELVALRPRFERARRRREAGVAGSMLAAAAVAAIVVISGTGGEERPQRVDVAGSNGELTTTTAQVTTSVSPSTTATTAVTTTAPSPSVTVPGPTSTVRPDGGRSVIPASTTPTRSPTTTAAPTPTTAEPATPETEVADCDGGTATIRWTPTSVTVVSTSPAPGWTLEKITPQSATRVVVTFRRDGGGPGSSSAKIDARLVNGELQVDS